MFATKVYLSLRRDLLRGLFRLLGALPDRHVQAREVGLLLGRDVLLHVQEGVLAGVLQLLHGPLAAFELVVLRAELGLLLQLRARAHPRRQLLLP